MAENQTNAEDVLDPFVAEREGPKYVGPALGKIGTMLGQQGQDLREAGRAALFEPEAFNPSAPFQAALGTVGARLPMTGQIQGTVGSAGGKMFQPSGLIAQEGKKVFEKARTEAAQAMKQMPPGTGPLNLSGNLRSNVPQFAVPRYNPPRGISDRLLSAMANPNVVAGVRRSMEAGIRIGAHNWYHNDPLRRAWIAELGEQEGGREFARLMDYVAGTSPGSDVPTNIRNASYYYLMTGRELPEKLPYPYGHTSQQTHRSNIAKLQQRAGVGAEHSPEYRGWDIFTNPKPVSFSEDLQGNLIPVAADTHAMRNIAMRTGDPRWLATSTREVTAKGRKPSDFQRQWGEIKYDNEKDVYVVTYRPQQLVESGRLSMKEAKGLPAFWADTPNKNEYAAVEQFYSDIAAKLGLAPAEGQAAAWSGAGELTGLGTPPDKTFAQMFNERVMYTSLLRNEAPEDTLRYLIRKQKPLLGFGGAGLLGMEGLKEQLEAGGDGGL
jgi:hypothetical protein